MEDGDFFAHERSFLSPDRAGIFSSALPSTIDAVKEIGREVEELGIHRLELAARLPDGYLMSAVLITETQKSLIDDMTKIGLFPVSVLISVMPLPRTLPLSSSETDWRPGLPSGCSKTHANLTSWTKRLQSIMD